MPSWERGTRRTSAPPSEITCEGKGWDLGRRPSGEGSEYSRSSSKEWHLKFKAAKKIKQLRH